MRDTLVVISLRGGVDALNAVIPYGEDAYYRARPTIAVPPPGSSRQGAIDLDGRFGLHPALAPLEPLYRDGTLAVVHAVGWPGDSHSHFEAWDEIESGAPGPFRPRDGWLARLLAAAPAGSSPIRAVAFAETMPRLFSGFSGACAMRTLQASVLADGDRREHRMCAALRSLYDESSELGMAGRRTLDALESIASHAADARSAPGGPAYPETDFGEQLRGIEILLRAEVGLEAASAELAGWDTHVGQGGAEGSMAERLGELAHGLATFAARQTELLNRLTTVVLSEFGRRVAENGGAGTDHGQGGVMLVLGGGARGGRVYGEWPGLAPERLSGPGDLAATTDVRDVLGALVASRAGERVADSVFPGYRPRSRLALFGE